MPQSLAFLPSKSSLFYIIILQSIFHYLSFSFGLRPDSGVRYQSKPGHVGARLMGIKIKLNSLFILFELGEYLCHGDDKFPHIQNEFYFGLVLFV